jgi:benzoate/toluate 1,2-dioxygenase subunit beta
VNRSQVENLLYAEARLLDEGRFGEWLELFTDDAVYWIPVREEDADPTSKVSLVYDDRRRLELRVERLTGGFAHAQDPASRVYRLVGNIEVDEEGDPETEVRCVLAIFETRGSAHQVLAARCRYVLRMDGVGPRIARKEVILLNGDQPIDNLTFLI